MSENDDLRRKIERHVLEDIHVPTTMKESPIREEVVLRRIENDLEIIAGEMAKLCTPARTSESELRLTRSLIFGLLGDSAIWVSISEKPYLVERQFKVEVMDGTFEPGRNYSAPGQNYSIVRLRSSDDQSNVRLLLSEMRAKLVAEIRAAVKDVPA